MTFVEGFRAASVWDHPRIETQGWTTNWHKHPGVRSGDKLTRGERAADRMWNIMGSRPFVFCFFGIMIAWPVCRPRHC